MNVPERRLWVVDDRGEAAAPMAAAMAAAMLPRWWRVDQAAIAPADAVHPGAHAVMAEWGIDLQDWPPRPYRAELVQSGDVVAFLVPLPVELTPVGAELADWTVRGGGGRTDGPDAMRSLRDRIHRRVEAWAVDRG